MENRTSENKEKALRIFRPKKILEKDWYGFYQSKYDYYRTITRYVTLLMILSNIAYFIVDCFFRDSFVLNTLFIRMIPLFPFIPYCIFDVKVRDWNKIFFYPYLCAHLCVISTMFANGMIVGKQTTPSIFILMQFAFLGLGFGTPFIWHLAMFAIYFVELSIAHSVVGYHFINTTVLLSLPVAIGGLLTLKAVEDAYVDLFELKRKLWHQTMTDNLTQVNNRNKLNDILIKDTKRVKWREETTILMFDIDHFKTVNDTYGHDAGDIVLVSVAKILSGMVRQSDYIIRWGGEEFIIILPNSKEPIAYEIAERIRKKIEQSENGICPVTVSVGISVYDGIDIENSIDHADNALYYAKENGRNQTILYSDIKDTLPQEEYEKTKPIDEMTGDDT